MSGGCRCTHLYDTWLPPTYYSGVLSVCSRLRGAKMTRTATSVFQAMALEHTLPVGVDAPVEDVRVLV
jgi:hypothetical protein